MGVNIDNELRMIQLLGFTEEENKKDKHGNILNVLDGNGNCVGTITRTYVPDLAVWNSVSCNTYSGRQSDGIFTISKICDCSSQTIVNFGGKYVDEYSEYNILTIRNNDFTIGFGLFDFSDGAPVDKIDAERQKEYCDRSNYGFYLNYHAPMRDENGTFRDEWLIFANSPDKPNNQTYEYYIEGKNIKVCLGGRVRDGKTEYYCFNSTDPTKNKEGSLDQSVEELAKNDINGMAFFNKMREIINAIVPFKVPDVLSSLITGEEIEKYGLHPYFEQKDIAKSAEASVHIRN